MRPTDEVGQRHAVALALLAQQGVGADRAVLEGDLTRVGRFLAQFLLDRCDAIAGRPGRHDEAGDAALGRAGIGDGEDQRHVGGAARGDELLHAVQHPAVALAHRARLEVEASEPACGSVRQKAPRISPRASGFSHFSFCSGEP